MNRLTLGALTALAATQIAGCIITSDNDLQEDAFITVNWQLKNVGSNQLAPCPPGFDTVAFYSQETVANGVPFGEKFVDLFPCNVGTATSAPLPPSTYVSWIEITNSNNTATFAQSLAAYVDVRFEDKFFDAAIFFNGGYFQFDWQLVGASSGDPLQCSRVPDLDNVRINSFVVTPDTGIEDVYNCEDHTAITAVLGAGLYSVLFHALDSAEQALGEGIQLNNQRIDGPNRVTDLGLVTLPIDDL